MTFLNSLPTYFECILLISVHCGSLWYHCGLLLFILTHNIHNFYVLSKQAKRALGTNALEKKEKERAKRFINNFLQHHMQPSCALSLSAIPKIADIQLVNYDILGFKKHVLSTAKALTRPSSC